MEHREVRFITEQAWLRFKTIMASELGADAIEHGSSVYASYWDKRSKNGTSKEYNWTASDYGSLGFQYKFVNKWMGEMAKDRVMEWYCFFSKIYDQRLQKLMEKASGRIQVRLFLIGAGPSFEMYALAMYLEARRTDADIRLAELHAFDIADWTTVTQLLLQSYASLTIEHRPTSSDCISLDNSAEMIRATSLDFEKLKDAFSALQSVCYYNGERLISEEGSSVTHRNQQRSKDVNDPFVRDGICGTINNSEHDQHAAGMILNVVCVSHWLSHCDGDECDFMKQFQHDIGSSSCVDILLNEEQPSFRKGGGAHARAGKSSAEDVPEEEVTHFKESIADGWSGCSVQEGYQGFKSESRNFYFYTNFAPGDGVGENCPPATKLNKAERQWEQHLFSCNAQQRSLHEDLLQMIEAWREEHAAAITQASACFPIWVCKRIAFVTVRGGSVRDVLLGKELTAPCFDSLMDLVSKWRLQHQEKCKEG